MRISLFIIFVAFVIISCKSNTKHNVNDTVSRALSTDPSSELIKIFKPILKGVWIKKDYIDKIRSTRSPAAASDLAVGMTAFSINTDSIKGDSVIAMAGWNNHEGGDVTVKFKHGGSSSSIIFNGNDLSYKIKNGDTVVTINELDEKSKQLKGVQFIRTSSKIYDLNIGVGQFINKILVAGIYTLIDSTGTKSNVTFNADGKVSGFFNFTDYGINIDLNTDVRDNLDNIGFNVDHKKHDNYTYKINKDTLSLFTTKVSADSSELILDKLKYKLVRSK